MLNSANKFNSIQTQELPYLSAVGPTSHSHGLVAAVEPLPVQYQGSVVGGLAVEGGLLHGAQVEDVDVAGHVLLHGLVALGQRLGHVVGGALGKKIVLV